MYWLWITSAAVFAGLAVFIHARQWLQIAKIWNRTKVPTSGSPVVSTVKEIVSFSKDFSKFAPGLELIVEEVQDNFLKHSLRSFLTGAVRGPELLRSLRQAAEEYHHKDLSDIHELQKTVRFLPAVGWTVALLGMAWFFLSESNSQPYMVSAGLVFTAVLGTVIYGLCFNYFLIEPLMGRVRKQAVSSWKKNQLVIESVGLLMKSKSPFEIYEHLSLVCPELNGPEAGDFMKQIEVGAA